MSPSTLFTNQIEWAHSPPKLSSQEKWLSLTRCSFNDIPPWSGLIHEQDPGVSPLLYKPHVQQDGKLPSHLTVVCSSSGPIHYLNLYLKMLSLKGLCSLVKNWSFGRLSCCSEFWITNSGQTRTPRTCIQGYSMKGHSNLTSSILGLEYPTSHGPCPSYSGPSIIYSQNALTHHAVIPFLKAQPQFQSHKQK